MKKLVHAMACFIITASSVALAQSQDAARVVYSEFGCTWYVAANDKGYYLFEWFGGHMPDRKSVV